MIYRDTTHRELYEQWLQQTHTEGDDVEYSALFYLLAADEITRKHVTDIFDFEERCIKPWGLFSAPWQTSTSRKTIRLAFNLFNCGMCCDMDKNGEFIELTSDLYTPGCIFACSYAPYYIQAIKIRYPHWLFLSDSDEYRDRPEPVEDEMHV